jgi:hypothetical protein
MEEGSSTRDFERWLKGALRMGHLSLKRLTAERLEGGLIYWGPWVVKGRFWRWASIHGGSVGQPGVGSSNRDLRDW